MYPLDWSLIAGPLPVILLVSALLALAWLVAGRNARVRLSVDHHPGFRAVPCICSPARASEQVRTTIRGEHAMTTQQRVISGGGSAVGDAGSFLRDWGNVHGTVAGH